MNEAGRLYDFHLLLLKILEGQATHEEIEAFNTLLRQNPQALKDYRDIIDIYVDMTQYGGIYWDSQMAELQQLADYERTAPSVEIDRSRIEPDIPVQNIIYPKMTRKINKVPLVTAILLSAALLAIIAVIQFVPINGTQEVATLSESVKAHFAGDDSFASGARLSNRKEPYCLQNGIIKVILDRGAEVIIEAPCEFQLESANKIDVYCGRAYARVSGQAKGFTIDTPTATVIDLGTEFGVKINYDGTSEVHVMKGQTTLLAGPKNKQSTGQSIIAGQARRVTLDGQITIIPMRQEIFAQRVDSQLILDMNFEGLGGSTLPSGWNLIDNNGAGIGPDYTVLADQGPAGNGDTCGRVGPGGGTLQSGPHNTPGGWIQSLKPFDSALGFQGSFDLRLGNTSDNADAQFLFGNISEGAQDYHYVAISSRKELQEFFTVTAGIRKIIRRANIAPNLTPEVWYHFSFRFIPLQGTTGRFSYEITDLAGTKTLCSLDPVTVTLPDILTFGLGNYNDTACFDNIKILPLSKPDDLQSK